MVAVAVVVVLHELKQPMNLPLVSFRVLPHEFRVKIVGQKAEQVTKTDTCSILAAFAIATICGDDPATADRYEARNDVLRSIARRRDLSHDDVALLMAYLGSTNDVLRAERTAALKNDVLNLLRNQHAMAGTPMAYCFWTCRSCRCRSLDALHVLHVLHG